MTEDEQLLKAAGDALKKLAGTVVRAGDAEPRPLRCGSGCGQILEKCWCPGREAREALERIAKRLNLPLEKFGYTYE